MTLEHDADPGDAEASMTGLAEIGGLGSRKLVFDSGLISIDDPRIIALHEGYDDLVKIFARSIY